MKKANAHSEKQPAVADPPAAAEPLVTVEAATVTPEQLAELKAQAARAHENWDRLLRTTADFDNFKKRAAREKQEAVKYANEGLLQKLVPVLDSLDMALAAALCAGSDVWLNTPQRPLEASGTSGMKAAVNAVAAQQRSADKAALARQWSRANRGVRRLERASRTPQ